MCTAGEPAEQGFLQQTGPEQSSRQKSLTDRLQITTHIFFKTSETWKFSEYHTNYTLTLKTFSETMRMDLG